MKMAQWLVVILCVGLLSACAKHNGAPPDHNRAATHGSAPMMMPAPTPHAEASQPNIPAPSSDVVIGVLLPLSGAHAEVGTQLRDAALMALFDKLNSLSSLEVVTNPRLVVKDTMGDARHTKEQTKILLQEGAKIILGPLLSDNVEAAKSVTKGTQVPIIAFSNNARVAGDNTYVFGFQSEEQVRRIADFATKQKIEHYAALAPQTTYGRMVVGQFSTIVKGRGYSLQPVNFFTEGEVPPAPVLNRIVNEAREWGDKRKGVFLPLTGQSLAAISTRLLTDDKMNPGFIKLLGTGLWDEDEVLRIPAMQGAWFATSPTSNSRRFDQKFAKTYGKQPSRIASLAYDAVALLSTLALSPAQNPFSPQSLQDPNGFSGPANGIFRFTPHGTVERALAVVEVSPYGFQTIDPAPVSF